MGLYDVVAIHADASSYDVAGAELRAVAVTPIRGNRILTSQRLMLSFPLIETQLEPGQSEQAEPALSTLLRVIGDRPLVGYYLDFTVALLNRHLQPIIGAPLPNERIEVSSLYYESKPKVPGKNALDLRLTSIIKALNLPACGGKDASSKALASAMIYLRLRPMGRQPDKKGTLP